MPPSPGSSADHEGEVMSYKKRDLSSGSKARKAFRLVDAQRPLSDYEKEQRALRTNLERLKAERLAREAAKSKDH